MSETLSKRSYSTETEQPSSESWDTSAQTVANFHQEGLFQNTLMDHHFDPNDMSTRGYAKTLSEYAQDYCATHSDVVDEKTVREICLIASTPLYIHQQSELSVLDGLPTRKPHEQRRYKALKRDVVQYNQQLSSYIHTYPDTSFSLLQRNLTEQTVDHFPGLEDKIGDRIATTAIGARTEAVTQQLLDTFAIPYESGTIDEDLRGGDIILTIQDMRIPVDIKTSLDKVVTSKEGYTQLTDEKKLYTIRGNPPHETIVMFPGFTADQLGDSCMLPEDMAYTIAPYFAGQLQRAVNELSSTERFA